MATLARALRWGVAPTTVVCLRHLKGAADDTIVDEGRAVVAMVRRAGGRCLLHSRYDLVAAVGADGVHLASVDDPRVARKVLGSTAIIGWSLHPRERPSPAAQAAANYATWSPIWSPSSKRDARPTLGLEGLRAATSTMALPLLALGGIEAARVSPCVHAGAAGVAVSGLVMGAADPGRAVQALERALQHTVRR